MNTLRTELLRQYKTGDTLIETGTAKGEGVICAVEAGFDRVVTIEANEEVFYAACKRFCDDEHVNICLGDSGDLLPILLQQIHEPVTFWLDAHWSTGESETGANKCPLMKELAAIKKHPVKGHTILIDDMRYFRKGGLPQWHNISLEHIEQAVLSIDKAYVIEFHRGLEEDDILVATYEAAASQ